MADWMPPDPSLLRNDTIGALVVKRPLQTKRPVVRATLSAAISGIRDLLITLRQVRITLWGSAGGR